MNHPDTCPFCKSSDIRLQKDIAPGGVHARRFYCEGCGARQHFSFHPKEVIAQQMALKKWNRRVR